jgi:hypothetical protein
MLSSELNLVEIISDSCLLSVAAGSSAKIDIDRALIDEPSVPPNFLPNIEPIFVGESVP